MDVLLDGLVFPESPRWHDGALWLSDWGANEVIRYDGTPEVVAQVPSFPMCIDFLPDGRLLVVDSAHHRLLRQEPDGSLATHADLSALSTKPWNEVVVDGRGNAYVNGIGFDFPGDLPGGEVAPGLLALVTSDGTATQVAGDLAFPNGMAVTLHGELLVAESYAGRLTAFTIELDGSLSGRRVWAELGDAAPDGICVDAEGAAWYADVPHQRCVRVREGGEVLQTVELDRGAFSCALGDTTLYVVANQWQGQDAEARGQLLALPAPAPRA
jgi:sugar lactone lactonase YvrE